MKVIIERDHCQTINDAACEQCFGRRLEIKEFDLGVCVMAVSEPEDTETIHIDMLDRDGTTKQFVITPENYGDVYDGWMKYYEEVVAGD